MAFILAGIVALVTLCGVVLIVFADMMSDSPTTSISPAPTAIIGFGLAGLIAASHWMPHFSW